MKFEQIYLCESYPVISLFNHENLSWKSTGSTPIGFNCPAVSFGLTPESYQLFVGEILAMLDIFAFACSLWFMKIVERNPKLSDVLLTCLVSCSDCYWVNPSILKVAIDRVALGIIYFTFIASDSAFMYSSRGSGCYFLPRLGIICSEFERNENKTN